MYTLTKTIFAEWIVNNCDFKVCKIVFEKVFLGNQPLRIFQI